MATLGEQFRAAREARGLSQTEAGAATKTLTKVIDSMENDDFSEMAAPTYAKGFIRLYATFLNLDSEPLVAEYIEKNPAKPRMLLDRDSQLQQSTIPGLVDKKEGHGFSMDWLHGIREGCAKAWNALPGTAWKDVRVLGGGIAALLVLIVLISLISTCTKRRAADRPAADLSPPAPARSLLDEPLPDLYLVEPGQLEAN